MQAWLTRMGRGMPSRWAFPDEPAWLAARAREETFLRAVEERLAAQTPIPVPLVGTALDGTLPPGGTESDLALAEDVGGADGLAPLQNAILTWLEEQRWPEQWRPANAREPLRRVRARPGEGAHLPFRHLLEHDPVSGFFLPVAFDHPLWLPGALRGEREEQSVGSASHVAEELRSWAELASKPPVPGWLARHAQNLALVARAAMRTGLAIELA